MGGAIHGPGGTSWAELASEAPPSHPKPASSLRAGPAGLSGELEGPGQGLGDLGGSQSLGLGVLCVCLDACCVSVGIVTCLSFCVPVFGV